MKISNYHASRKTIVNSYTYDEIFLHNRSLDLAINTCANEKQILSDQIRELNEKRIHPVNEMVGAGLRKTYIEIAREALEIEKLQKWHEENNKLRFKEKVQKAQKAAFCTIVSSLALFITVYVVLFYYVFAPNLKFGDNMSRLSICKQYNELNSFVSRIFDRAEGGGDLSNVWRQDVPPELMFNANMNLYSLKCARNTFIENVFRDPKDNSLYHVQCRVETDDGDKKFRLQCTCMENECRLVAVN